MADPTSSAGPLDDVERRLHSRSYVAGVALLSHPNHGTKGACLVRNLSAGGALLLSSPPLAPGESCRVVLTAPGLMGEELEACVNRVGTTRDGAPWAAVEFVNVTEEKSLRLRRVVDLELLAANAPAVLVVDGNIEKLQNTANLLAVHSRKTHLANTALFAIDLMQQRNRRIALTLVGYDIAGTTPAELLSYVGSEFPQIHRAALDKIPTQTELRRLLDRVEFESADHDPWKLSDLT